MSVWLKNKSIETSILNIKKNIEEMVLDSNLVNRQEEINLLFEQLQTFSQSINQNTKINNDILEMETRFYEEMSNKYSKPIDVIKQEIFNLVSEKMGKK
jgi:hypothetical protein